MGQYNVIQPCFAAGRHHVRPTGERVEVEDDEAAPLVEAGCLEPRERMSTATDEADRVPDRVPDATPDEPEGVYADAKALRRRKSNRHAEE